MAFERAAGKPASVIGFSYLYIYFFFFGLPTVTWHEFLTQMMLVIHIFVYSKL